MQHPNVMLEKSAGFQKPVQTVFSMTGYIILYNDVCTVVFAVVVPLI